MAIASALMSTLGEIESAVVELPRADQAALLDFVAAHLRESATVASSRTGAELASLWAKMPHLSEEEAADFERDLAAIRATDQPHSGPAWE